MLMRVEWITPGQLVDNNAGRDLLLRSPNQSMRRYALTVLLPLLFAAAAQAQSPPGDLALVEQPVTTWQPVTQRVIVPVRTYHTERRVHGWWNPFQEPHVAYHQVPTTRWEERLQTTYVPVTRRQFAFRPHTGSQPLPPLVFATPPSVPTAIAQQRPAGLRPPPELYDQPRLVAVPPPAANARTAQAPATTTLVPRPR